MDQEQETRSVDIQCNFFLSISDLWLVTAMVVKSIYMEGYSVVYNLETPRTRNLKPINLYEI